MTTEVKEPKKFAVEWQNTDDNGNPVGPPQKFEGDTQKELIDELIRSNKNAAREMYKEKKARKIGDLISPDPEKPLQKFERKQLTADERTRISNGLKDPQTSVEAMRQLMEAELGASPDAVREALQYAEVRKRIDMAQEQTDIFLSRHTDYVQCSSNQEMILKWLEKRNLAITAKNLELAYESLDDLMTKRAAPKPEPKPAPTQVSTPVSAAATPVESVTPAPTPQPAEIPTAATPAPAITEPPAEVRQAAELKPKASSSGLSRENASAAPGVEPAKAKEIPYAYLAKLNSINYAKWLADPANRDMVKEMDKRR